ncbi:MAG TPA: M20/M25/M40 family metallo-hydrolase, partial [Candidatus Limnocylindrales bacterium]
PNVVAERCQLQVDVRSTTRDGIDAVGAAIAELCAEARAVPGVAMTVEETSRHMPMEKLERSGRLAERAISLAAGLGIELRDAATGGASDANTTAGMGVPTLDGLGPIGGLDHSPGEYLEVASIVPRTTLLAALVAAIGRDPEVRAWAGERRATMAAAASS